MSKAEWTISRRGLPKYVPSASFTPPPVIRTRPPKWGVDNPISPFDYIPDEVGHRLASLTDGEGCFSIHHNSRWSSWQLEYAVVLRWDDVRFLRRMDTALGCPGRFTRIEPKHPSTLPNTKPQVRWSIGARHKITWLVHVFDYFPLWSKKARDYHVWRKAAYARAAEKSPETHAILERCFHEIREARVYRELDEAVELAP